MEKIIRASQLSKASNDTSADIDLINKYTLTPLAPEGVFTFSVALCTTEIDRDIESFTKKCIDGLAQLFLGKTGIFNHSWNAKDQIARIYRTAVEQGEGINDIGEQLYHIRADAYIPRGAETDSFIAKIESGIHKEVSVGCAVKDCTCSICGKPMKWWGECEDGHRKGLKYEEGLCYGKLENPIDAYEFSFVAVPAQRGAGVVKCCGKCKPEERKGECANKEPCNGVGEIIEALKEKASEIGELDAGKLMRMALAAQEGAEDRAKRKSYLEKYGKNNDTERNDQNDAI